MTALGKLKQALAPLGVPVYSVRAPFQEPLPNSYIVLTVVDDRPGLYAGDTDEDGAVQLRASWYCRQGHEGHKAALKHTGRAAGFTVLSSSTFRDNTTGHDVLHQEFWIESED